MIPNNYRKSISNEFLANLTGFDSSSYFTKQFRKIVGVSPITYLKINVC
ncbi:AraC family transcriptional regulator [bacterium]|nr:AraC family transcriptional regulator [bacterium]